jgi:acyl-coenzyme A synthetase/AMP-(fatty) acid ligase
VDCYHLTAYFSPKHDATDAIHQWMADRLPRYMMPNQLIDLDQLPLHASGKIDYLTLAAHRVKKKHHTMDYIMPMRPY